MGELIKKAGLISILLVLSCARPLIAPSEDITELQIAMTLCTDFRFDDTMKHVYEECF